MEHTFGEEELNHEKAINEQEEREQELDRLDAIADLSWQQDLDEAEQDPEFVREMRNRELHAEAEFLRDYQEPMGTPVSQKEVSPKSKMQRMLESQAYLTQQIYKLKLDKEELMGKLHSHTLNHTWQHHRNCSRCRSFQEQIAFKKAAIREAEDKLERSYGK